MHEFYRIGDAFEVLWGKVISLLTYDLFVTAAVLCVVTFLFFVLRWTKGEKRDNFQSKNHIKMEWNPLTEKYEQVTSHHSGVR